MKRKNRLKNTEKKSLYEQKLDMDNYDFITWLSDQFDIDTPQRLTTETDVNRALEVLTVYAESISYLEELASFCKLYCRELKRLGAETKEAYEDMVDKQAAINNKIQGLTILYRALNKNVTLIAEQLNRIPDKKMYQNHKQHP